MAAFTFDAARERLELRIERRVIKSPIAGSIGTLAGKKTGSLVQKGEVLVTMVPTAELQVVALLPVSTALGRVEVGQHARLRLDGFPWTQFGSLTATVARVGQESQDGMLRVELDADHASLRRLPLRHGLTGNLDIEVEQLRPIDLVLRKLAQHLGRDPA